MPLALGVSLLTLAAGSAEPGRAALLTVGAPVRITDRNRRCKEMMGGWGPHLRGLMRDARGTLWFAAESGSDVLHYTSLLYYRLGKEGWEEAASIAPGPGVQQNMAHLTDGESIWSYGVNTANGWIEECCLSTVDPARRSTQPLMIGGAVCNTLPSSNYVGAAIHPSGTKVVWWTVVGANGAPGQWCYAYRPAGGEWAGPIVHPIGEYNDYAYIHAKFRSATRLTMVGQGYLGHYPNGSYRAVAAELTLGRELALGSLLLAGSGEPAASGNDVWVDPRTGDTHLLAQSGADVGYYYRPAGEGWTPANTRPRSALAGTFRARFAADRRGWLYLVSGDTVGQAIRVQRVAIASVRGPIDWPVQQTVSVPSPAVGGQACALYVGGEPYQVTPPGDLEFAVCGAYPTNDNGIWYYRASR